MNQAITPYHHGDLRNCAIIAAAELIEAMGSYDITIAQVAKRTGVSAPALYRHFKDKDALLSAVRELAHIGIMEYTTGAQDQVEHGTLEHLDALGAAYLRFALDKKAFFGLMWENHGDAEERRAEARAKRTGFQLVHEAIELYFKSTDLSLSIRRCRLPRFCGQPRMVLPRCNIIVSWIPLMKMRMPMLYCGPQPALF
jgi:AcrR family transcriptional regulator